MSVNWPDLAVALFVVVGAVRGYQRGLVREGIAFAALALGLTLAGQWHQDVAEVMRPFVGGGRLVSTLAYFLVVLAVLAGGTLVTVIVLRLMRLLLVGWLDKLGGLAFGAGQGAVLAAMGLFLLIKYPTMGLDHAVLDSELAMGLLNSTLAALVYLPPELAPVAAFFELPPAAP